MVIGLSQGLIYAPLALPSKNQPLTMRNQEMAESVAVYPPNKYGG